mgnify:FL=1
MPYTMSVQEALDVFRKYGIQMGQPKLQEGLRQGIFPFGFAIELEHWTFTIWRLDFYEWLSKHGVAVEELKTFREELKNKGWEA